MEQYLPMLLTIVGGLVIVVNIVVEVIKKFTAAYIPTNFVAVALSLALTLAAFFAWASIEEIIIEWYYVVGAVVVGFMVAYAAMFGFDKLKQALSGFGKAALAEPEGEAGEENEPKGQSAAGIKGAGDPLRLSMRE